MIPDYIRTCNEEVKKKVMGFRDSSDVWIENIDVTAESLVGFVLLFSNKAVTILKNTALVAYYVHAILSNVSVQGRQWLIHKEIMLVEFLLVSGTQEPLKEEEGPENKEMLVYGFTSLMNVLMESGV